MVIHYGVRRDGAGGEAYRFYPSPEQETELRRTFGCVRKVYNLALEARTTAWHAEQRRVSYVETSAMLTAWKREPGMEFLSEVSSVPLQRTLRHLQSAFAAFWQKRTRYPRFKSRPLPEGAVPSTVTMSVDAAGRWHVSILVETAVDALPPSGSAVRVDAGITSLVTLSTGQKVANPRHEKRDRDRLARAISDAAWHELRGMLEYKAVRYGRDLVVIDRWYPSSKVCSACGHTAASIPLQVREWTCATCGTSHDRDVNAAKNILAAGRAVTARGDGVRPTRR